MRAARKKRRATEVADEEDGQVVCATSSPSPSATGPLVRSNIVQTETSGWVYVHTHSGCKQCASTHRAHAPMQTSIGQVSWNVLRAFHGAMVTWGRCA